MQRGPPTPSQATPEELFVLILGAALLTAPLCKLLRSIGERVRDQCCDDDDDDDEVEVDHACEGEGEGEAEDEGEDEGEERDVDDASSV